MVYLLSNILYTPANTKMVVSILTLKKLIGNSSILRLIDNRVRAVAENLYEHPGKLTTAGIQPTTCGMLAQLNCTVR